MGVRTIDVGSWSSSSIGMSLFVWTVGGKRGAPLEETGFKSDLYQFLGKLPD